MRKRELLQRCIGKINRLLERYENRVELLLEDELVTHRMVYDLKNSGVKTEYAKYRDYFRYRTFELVADEIRDKYSQGDISNYCVAEAGVFLGDFAWVINRRFPECDFYLYDTFEGFVKKDEEIELSNDFTDQNSLKRFSDDFRDKGGDSEEKIRIAKSKMKHPEKCIFRKGYFPDTAQEEKNKKWLFVSLDLDLYKPIYEGIKFFWPNLITGGICLYMTIITRTFQGSEKHLANMRTSLEKYIRYRYQIREGQLFYANRFAVC